MAKGKMTWSQRDELHEILDWIRSPVATQTEYNVRQCVKHFLNCRDAQVELEKRGVAPLAAKRAADTARVYLNNKRAKRRPKAAEILKSRETRISPEFTSGNFRFTIDTSQHRNYGMVSASIYCVVEVWTSDDELEKDYLVNYSDHNTKEWLTRLLVWGLMNSREILIKAATEAEMTSKKMFMPKEKV